MEMRPTMHLRWGSSREDEHLLPHAASLPYHGSEPEYSVLEQWWEETMPGDAGIVPGGEWRRVQEGDGRQGPSPSG